MVVRAPAGERPHQADQPEPLRHRFLPLRDKLAYPIIEPGSWVMERKMLLTIKQRAEQLAHEQTAR